MRCDELQRSRGFATRLLRLHASEAARLGDLDHASIALVAGLTADEVAKYARF